MTKRRLAALAAALMMLLSVSSCGQQTETQTTAPETNSSEQQAALATPDETEAPVQQEEAPAEEPAPVEQKQAVPLALSGSSKSLTMLAGDETKVLLELPEGATFTVKSSNGSVTAAPLDGENGFSVKAVSTGTSKITVTAKKEGYEASSLTVAVKVSAPAATRSAQTTVRMPEASGASVLGNDRVTVDVSNTSQGYIMIKYTGSVSKVAIQITGNGGSTYTYFISPGGYHTFPLSQGSGSYQLGIFEQVSGNQYSVLFNTSIPVSLKNNLVPFLYPNDYVWYTASSAVVAKGAALASTASNDLGVVEAVYNWTVKNISYDYGKASSVQSGYLPSADKTLTSCTGICLDYAAVMVAMLRTQNIPCKMVVGYAGSVYHAWISVYITDVGWVDGMIYFDGSGWKRMDPTFASTGNSSQSIMDYIANNGNYNAMYFY